jgi:hypothetical protein
MPIFLLMGKYGELDSANDQLYMYLQKTRRRRQEFVLANRTDSEQEPPDGYKGWALICSRVDTESEMLQPWGGRTY